MGIPTAIPLEATGGMHPGGTPSSGGTPRFKGALGAEGTH